MTPEELKKFKNEVADPAMNRLLNSAVLVDGHCYINNVDIAYVDGRSWGVECIFKATGFEFSDGVVKYFELEVADVGFNEFLDKIRDCFLITDGKVTIDDELNEAHLTTTIRSIGFLSPIYKDFELLKEMKFSRETPEYLKMRDNFIKGNVKRWYCDAFPDDVETRSFINSRVTFDQLYSILKKGGLFYDALGNVDTTAINRIFYKLAELKGVNYVDIYNLWVYPPKQRLDLQIGNAKPKIETDKDGNHNKIVSKKDSLEK